MADPAPIIASGNGAKIISRTLPDYSSRKDNWDFMKSSYIGGKSYINAHLFKYYIEGDDEFRDRKARAHRENHCKRVVDLFTSYLFQEQPIRQTTDKRLEEFHNNIDGKGKRIDQFMKIVSLWSSVLGRVYVMIDKPSLSDSQITGTAYDNVNPKAQPYCYMIFPQDIIDIAFNEDDSVKWVIIHEHVRDDDDPILSSGDIINRFRLWTANDWYLFDDKGHQTGAGSHGVGTVPMAVIDSEDNDLYDGQSMIGDIAYLDRAIFNNWSRLDAIVCDQTFSQLVFPIEGMVGDIANDAAIMEQYMKIAHNRILFYSSQAQVPPAYISPDASQAQFILSMLESLTTQLYASLGLKAETASEPMAQSGVAKAWDFDKLDKMLSSKADNLEEAERTINEMFNRWVGSTAECVVDYPEKFDTRSLADEIAMAQELSVMRISDTFTKEIEKMVAIKSLPKAKEEVMAKIMSEIDAKDMSLAPKMPVMPFDNVDDEDEDKDDEE